MNNLEYIKNAILKAGTGSGGVGDLTDKVGLLSKNIWQIAGIIIPILAGLAGIFAVFKLVQLGIKLSQSGDDPEERSQAIKAMMWWGVGLAVCVIAATVAPGLIFGLLGEFKPIEF